jgi:glucose/arabinose dehydrogenase
VIRTLAFLALLFASPVFAQDKLPKPIVSGLKSPESVAVDNAGRVFVTEIGEFGKDGDGRVVMIDKGQIVEFAAGMDDPKGIVAWTNLLFVADNKRVWKIDAKGKATVFVDEKAFPESPLFLNDIVADEQGVLYVSDSGDLKGNGGAIYRIDQKKKVSLVVNNKKNPDIKVPNGLVMDGRAFLLVLDFGSGELLRVKVADGTTTKVADGFNGGDGLAWDMFGRLFISSWKQGKVWGIPRPGEKAVLLAQGFESSADICLAKDGKSLLVPDMKKGTLSALSTTIPGWEVDDSPMDLKTEAAFPNLQWTGWKAETDKGKLFPLRPIFLTHAGDGSNRVFVGIQQGTIHTFPNDPKAEKTKIFLDIEKQVFYSDNENEQGLLGMAFHPQYKKNGEFFLFYTLKKDKTVNVLSRFKVSKDDPDRADPASEEILMRVKRPFWNHDGGTICFGPDGYLYIALGDGGAADDPFKHGQNLKSILAKVLRIDVDRKDDDKGYGIPKDNPFVGQPDAAPETWAYGLRNIWRMSFDRKTGKLWAGEVGQNLYEEIILIEKGGNYGWSIRESLHPFSAKGVDRRKDLIEPIWEYHHNVGKSITGGHVYRGKRLPELDGCYLYGDYVSTKIWALTYDETKKRVTANRPIRDQNQAIMSFGEDEEGEVYFMAATVSGRGIFRFVRDKKAE